MKIYIFSFHLSGFAGPPPPPRGLPQNSRIFKDSELMPAMTGWQRLDVTSCQYQPGVSCKVSQLAVRSVCIQQDLRKDVRLHHATNLL